MPYSKSKSIEVKYEELEQYDSRWKDELMTKKETLYASHIGTFLIWFSNLEHSLDIELANLINERSHDQGYIIIKDLEMSEKIKIFYNLLFPIIHFSSKRKKQKINQLVTVKKQLEDFSTLRNKIAHAKWNTLDKDGYVRINTKITRENGLITFKKIKITLAIMRQSITKMAFLTEKISILAEKILQ